MTPNDPYTIKSHFLRKAQQAIENNISNENWRTPQLAAAVHLSREQLHRKLKALTGKSSSEFIHSVRLSHAKKLLESSGLTVSEVAYNVGYKDPAHFTKKFKEMFGVSPSKFK